MRFTRLSHGAADAEIIAALHSRDLSHKGSQKRQDDYVRRTIQKGGDRRQRRKPLSLALHPEH